VRCALTHASKLELDAFAPETFARAQYMAFSTKISA
jgi:hypothetical protein